MRYKIIDDCLRNKQQHYPTMDFIQEIMEEKIGKKISVSTIQKDIKSMKEDELLGYRAPILFNRKYQGYEYTDPDYSISRFPLNNVHVHSIEFAASLLQPLNSIELVGNFNEAAKKILDVIDFSSSQSLDERIKHIDLQHASGYKGTQWLNDVVEAIYSNNKIGFDYKAFNAAKAKSRTLDPYLLKQYEHRWYVIGLENNVVKTFALDRIENLKILPEKFRVTHAFDAEKYFNHSFGITSFTGKPEKIVLRFTPMAGNYLKTVPLHKSQKILADTAKKFELELTVGITHEVFQKLLSYGASVKVLKPAKLATQLKNEARQMLKHY